MTFETELHANPELKKYHDEAYISRQKVKDAFDEHRKKAIITCDENCFCWDIEILLDDET